MGKNSFKSAFLLICIILTTFLLIHDVLAYNDGGSEGIVVRIIGYNPNTYEYNISCAIPNATAASQIDPLRHYGIDPVPQGSNENYFNTSPNFTWKLDPINFDEQVHTQAMYHMYCEAQNFSKPPGQTNLASEFHVDLRTSHNQNVPNIYVLTSNGPNVTLKCDPPPGTRRYSLSWTLRNREGPTTFPNLADKRIVNITVPKAEAGWDVVCNVFDKDTGKSYHWDMPIEFFDSGPAYIPTIEGCLPNQPCYQVSPTGIVPNGMLIVNVTLNSTPEQADIYINEVYKGTTNANGTLQVPNLVPALYNLVIRKSGYGEISTLVPIATGKTLYRNYSIRENVSIDLPPEGKCFSTVIGIPSNCTGGNIIDDSASGSSCRTITCVNGSSSKEILACNKPDGPTKQYFEMYKQTQNGSLVSQICIGPTCIKDNGYAKSSNFPICTGNATQAVFNGTLSLTTNPAFSDVYLNGVFQGATSVIGVIDIPNLVPGIYTLLVNKTNLVSNTSQITIASGQTLSYFVMLNAITAPAQNGSINITTVPTQAEVYLNNILRGVTDSNGILYLGVAPGNYNIGVKKSGYSDHNSAISIAEGQNVTLAVNLSVVNVETGCINYSSVQNIPANCTSGTFTTNTTSGNCRTLVCSNGGSSLQILACDKPDNLATKQYFEMYKQSKVGSLVSQICIGDTCIQNEGYKKSSNYPICINKSVITPPATIQNASLNITTIPSQSDVFLNGALKGTTSINGNLLIQNIVPGNYNLLVKKSGYFDNTTIINLNPGQNLSLMLSLSQNITNNPPNNTNDVFVRVVSANPDTKTYTFSCRMDPENSYLRDWFIRPDNGDLADETEEAVFIDKPSGEFLTYTFQNNTFYHITCFVENQGTLYRGYIHIDIRQNQTSWDPYIKLVNWSGLSSTLQCIYGNSPYSVSWDVVNAQTREVTVLGSSNPMTHSVSFYGLFAYRCSVSANGINYGAKFEVQYFDQGDPYFPDTKGVPDGIQNVWIRNTTTTNGSNNTTSIQNASLNISTSPSQSNVLLNGVLKGTTNSNGNLFLQNLIPGNYNLNVQKNGYSDHNSLITLNAGQTLTLSVTLTQNSVACYTRVQDMPATCEGTKNQDTFNGCRQIICSQNSNTMQVLACDKPTTNNAEYFEMYRQSYTGTPFNVCIANVCIRNEGYKQSGHYPLCILQNNTNSNNNSGNNNSGFDVNWIEPVQNQQNTPPQSFHLNVEVPQNQNVIASTQWEIWTPSESERVWYALNNIGNLRFHTHTPDGTFENSLAGQNQLGFASNYKVYVRFVYTNGTMSPWSSWRTFTTSAETFGNQNLTWTTVPGFKVEKFATGFDVPVHIAFPPQSMYSFLPENQRPYFYVTELYGKVKVVYKDGSQSVYADNLLNFAPFGSITGGGQMGVIGLYVDNETGDLYVGMTYVVNDTVENKVMKFVSSSNGLTYTNSTIIIDNLPSSPSHQVEQITKGPDGNIYINLGDGLNEGNAQNDNILAGKIIKILPNGTAQVYAKGFRNPFGADWRPGTNQLFITDNSPNTNDRLLKIEEGHNYLWGTGGNAYVSEAIDLLNVSPVDVEFNPGNSGFPADLNGRMYVIVAGPIYQKGPTNGKEVLEYLLSINGSIIGKRHFLLYTGTGYGTPIGLDFGPDGLYFTDIYGEPGFVGLGKTEGNVYMIMPGDPSNTSSIVGQFRAGIEVSAWYPKIVGNTAEYEFTCKGIDGSGTYIYDWNFGDGQTISYDTWQSPEGFGKKLHSYPYTNVDYNVSCTVHDQSAARTAYLVINPSDFIPEN